MRRTVLVASWWWRSCGAAAYASFFVAPKDAKQGLIQRIFYLHVASAWTGLTAFFICFVANLLYVWRRQPKWDWLGVSAAEVGLAFTTVVLITGPIWAHPVWGIWWTWDARLTSTFVLWLLYIAYLLLRTLIEEPDRRALLSALFGIFAFHRCAAGLWLDSLVADAASAAGHDGRAGIRAWTRRCCKVLLFSWLAMLGLMMLLLVAALPAGRDAR